MLKLECNIMYVVSLYIGYVMYKEDCTNDHICDSFNYNKVISATFKLTRAFYFFSFT